MRNWKGKRDTILIKKVGLRQSIFRPWSLVFSIHRAGRAREEEDLHGHRFVEESKNLDDFADRSSTIWLSGAIIFDENRALQRELIELT